MLFRMFRQGRLSLSTLNAKGIACVYTLSMMPIQRNLHAVIFQLVTEALHTRQVLQLSQQQRP